MQTTTTIKYFAFMHLPIHLQQVSKPIGELANLLEATVPSGPEKSAGMRKLLEAKDCFVRAALEKGYPAHPEKSSTMPPHQQRVVDEYADLKLRTEKLATFIQSETYQALGQSEQDRLSRQLEAMDSYCVVLAERIESFATV